MSKSDEIFITIFKDLIIEQDKAHPGTDENLNYRCKLHGTYIKNKRVLQMVKDYQDAIIESLLK